MTAASLPPPPAILIANDLLDGDVVFRKSDGWTRDPRAAFIAYTSDETQALALVAREAEARREVVEASIVDVDIRDGAPAPRHFRERFKTLGPSVRPDLGKQAQFPDYARAAGA
ncbi:MAG: DUF2849 domain-containing protein [Hyphomicrobiales bacterium]|nr:DUF2849 domain-containing protein [Hyphomicrobiales bacterium]